MKKVVLVCDKCGAEPCRETHVLRIRISGVCEYGVDQGDEIEFCSECAADVACAIDEAMGPKFRAPAPSQGESFFAELRAQLLAGGK